MFKKSKDGLIHTTDESRFIFRTNISKKILDQLNSLAQKNNTHVNYLLETGLENVLANGVINFDKQSRPNDRVQYKTTYDKKLLDSVKIFAKQNNLYINDVIEYSVNFINIEKVKKSNYRYRYE
jgi:hypothetical protein